MPIRDTILPEFDHEMATTRKRLAGHLAEIPGLCAQTIEQDSIDTNSLDGSPMNPEVMSSRKELPRKVSDEDLMKTWRLLSSGRAMMSMPRIAVVRGFILSHASATARSLVSICD
jgi:hypothetical protein